MLVLLRGRHGVQRPDLGADLHLDALLVLAFQHQRQRPVSYYTSDAADE